MHQGIGSGGQVTQLYFNLPAGNRVTNDSTFLGIAIPGDILNTDMDMLQNLILA